MKSYMASHPNWKNHTGAPYKEQTDAQQQFRHGMDFPTMAWTFKTGSVDRASQGWQLAFVVIIEDVRACELEIVDEVLQAFLQLPTVDPPSSLGLRKVLLATICNKASLLLSMQ